MASVECAPVAKVGGLGDFVPGLARALIHLGQRVEVVLPYYDCLRREAIQGLERAYGDLRVPFFDQDLPCDILRGQVEGIDCWFVAPRSPQGFFERGRIYGEPDDPARFTFFVQALLEFLRRSERHPDIIHCHDWHTGLLPVLLSERYQAQGLNRSRVCYTLHNLGFQGRVNDQVLRQSGLDPRSFSTPERLQDPGQPQAFNLMKGGIVYADRVTTVSPRYAWEVQHSPQGQGLQHTLRQYDHKFSGILNGIDYGVWNPLTDPLIPYHYGPDSLPNKTMNKLALRRCLGLGGGHKPLIAMVSRLDAQKGVELMRHTLLHGLAVGAQVVLLGSAQDQVLAAYFRVLKRETDSHPDAHLELGYDEGLAHLIYAAADLLVIPSRYEPCGLTQMIAMRYGTPPLVRQVGGLADTVFDAYESDQPFGERNGFVFTEYDPQALEAALGRVLGLWDEYPQYFRQLRLNGMAKDHSWTRPGRQYLDLYESIAL